MWVRCLELPFVGSRSQDSPLETRLSFTDIVLDEGHVVMTTQLFVPNRTSRVCGRNHLNPWERLPTRDRGAQDGPAWGRGVWSWRTTSTERGALSRPLVTRGTRLSQSIPPRMPWLKTHLHLQRERGVDSVLVCITQFRRRSRVRRGEWPWELSQMPHGLPHSGQSRA